MAKRQSWGLTARRHRMLPLAYALGGLGGVALFILLHALVSAPYIASLDWRLRLAVAATSVLGFVFSWIGAWRAHSADRGTRQLLAKLQETNKIVRESPRSYPEVFEYHVLKPLRRAADAKPEDSKTHHMNLLLSTPAYGYHVLGLRDHEEFQKGLERAQCNKQIILFSPDAHFFHVANTLLWYPLKEALPQKISEPRVAPSELAACIMDTLEILGHQVKWSQKHKTPEVAVWTTDQAVFRLTSFEFGEESDAYVVLTDAVTLTSDLHKFNGRLLAVPDTLYRHLVGFHKDADSFIENIKGCPYSLLSGDEAKLLPEELDWLRSDYLLLRTEQVLFDLACFDSQCRRVIALAWGARDDLNPESRVTEALTAILRGVTEYFGALLQDEPRLRWVPPTGEQAQKLQAIPKITEIIEATDRDFEAKSNDLESLLLETGTHDQWFERHLNEYFSKGDVAGDPAAAWIGAIFYLLTSGFRCSKFAHQRRKRALLPRSGEGSVASLASGPRAPTDSPPPVIVSETP